MKNLLQSSLILVLLLLAAITAASEIAIISASRLRLRRLASEGSRRAAIILKILETPERFFSTILVSNNIIDSLIAVLVAAIVIRFVGQGVWEVVISTLVAAFLIVVFEVAAKTVATNNSEKMSLVFARPMRLLIKISSPVVIAFEGIINVILRAVKAKTLSKSSLVTDDEIRALIKIGQEEGSLANEKYSMITKVFALHDTVVKAVMTPKKDVFSISIGANIDDVLGLIIESGYSRIPVYDASPDSISGIINMKDILMLSSNKDLVVLQDIMYPAVTVNASKKVTELLKEFQKGHTHMAIVVDSQNKLQGIVTLEDLIEEIIGEIEDEYDVKASNYKTKHIK